MLLLGRQIKLITKRPGACGVIALPSCGRTSVLHTCSSTVTARRSRSRAWTRSRARAGARGRAGGRGQSRGAAWRRLALAADRPRATDARPRRHHRRARHDRPPPPAQTPPD
ncbi:hypothetical protein EVAR_100754_1 [Eumeta japonica]|uniref:Uncharacterized protein n=1 Tax=Eumeta variegata TaxID=151549 RepID=A0A4C1ZCZ6_EUMVA|nr:hypothetical protein EVAR_100754_1 [Eumeta japonica]